MRRPEPRGRQVVRVLAQQQVQGRLGLGGWEFTEPGPAPAGGGEGRSGPRDFSVAVPARVLTNDAGLLLRLARAGRGLTMLYEGQVRDDLARGELVAVLEAYSTPFPGFYLYYPERRRASPALRALVDYLRRTRRGGAAASADSDAGTALT